MRRDLLHARHQRDDAEQRMQSRRSYNAHAVAHRRAPAAPSTVTTSSAVNTTTMTDATRETATFCFVLFGKMLLITKYKTKNQSSRPKTAA